MIKPYPWYRRNCWICSLLALSEYFSIFCPLLPGKDGFWMDCLHSSWRLWLRALCAVVCTVKDWTLRTENSLTWLAKLSFLLEHGIRTYSVFNKFEVLMAAGIADMLLLLPIASSENSMVWSSDDCNFDVRLFPASESTLCIWKKSVILWCAETFDGL